jgi:hypothetical protein
MRERERASWMRECKIWTREREKEGMRARKCRMEGKGWMRKRKRRTQGEREER